MRLLSLAACLLIITLPRFNLGDPGIIHTFTATAKATQYDLPLDVAGYVRLVEYYRGTTPADSLIPPFCYRPLVPLVASTLPLDPLTSINVINLISLFLSVLILEAILRRIGYGAAARTTGDLMFIVSFPTFYYGAIGFIDPTAVLVVTLGILLALRGGVFPFAVCIVLGTLVKETNALIVLLPGVRSWARGDFNSRIAVRVALLLTLVLVTALLVRLLSPFPEPGWFLVPRFESIFQNLSRPRAVLSLLLTLGLPGAFALVGVLRGKAESRMGQAHFRFFIGGAVVVAFLYLYSLAGAWADGRVIWVIYPFLIPIALTVWWSPTSSSLDAGASKGMRRSTAPGSGA